jgi:hypothetical protein
LVFFPRFGIFYQKNLANLVSQVVVQFVAGNLGLGLRTDPPTQLNFVQGF